MPFFGQVWLWSLAGFLVGALLCWALVARPARRRVIELEDSLADARESAGRRGTAYVDSGGYGTAAAPALLPGFERAQDSPDSADGRFETDFADERGYPGDRSEPAYADDRPGYPNDRSDADFFGDRPDSGVPDERSDADFFGDRSDSGYPGERSEPAFSDERSEPRLSAPPEPAEAVESTQLMAAPPVAPHEPVAAPPEVEPPWLPVGERFDVSRLDADSPAEQHLVDDLPDDTATADEPAASGGTIFTQHTTPIPAELIRRIDEDASLVDDLDEADGIDPHRGHFADALTPDDEDDWAASRGAHSREESEEPVTRYLPAVPADPEPAPTMFAPAVRPEQAEPEPTMFAPAVRPDHTEPEPRYTAAAHPERAEPEPTMFAPAVRPEQAEPESSMFSPDPRQAEFDPPARPDTEPAAARAELPRRRPEPEPTVFAPSVPEPVDEPETVEDAAQEAPPLPGSLPKRVPKKPGDRFPFGVRTSAPDSAPAVPERTSSSVTTAPPATDPEPDGARSLFEPIRPADEVPVAAKAPAPLPSRPRRGSRVSQTMAGGVDTFVSPGPFGPGSAMPLPGGNSPSSEYRVKASVTALRYCSPESPKFDRTVAEVWFRSVADAERVGFRPLA